jgi:D-amino peptidase
MEGVSSLVDPFTEASHKGKDHGAFRDVMTGEVRAAAIGLNKGGAEKVIVCDFHGSGKNIIFKDLPHYVELVRGDFRPGSGLDGFDGPVHGVVFLGAHAASFTRGAVIGHTYCGDVEIFINGKRMNEFSLLAAAWGERGVPPLLVSGDQAACSQAKGFSPQVLTVPTKEGIEFRAARCFHPQLIEERLEEQSELAMKTIEDKSPFMLSDNGEYELSISLPAQPWADRLCWIPGAILENDRTYKFELKSMIEVINIIYGASMLRFP